jgi:hypothetical protein
MSMDITGEPGEKIKYKDLSANTVAFVSCRSKEPGKPEESGFSPKKSECSARNVLEHCRD